MREIIDILDEINLKLTFDKTIVKHGLATLQTKDDKTFPLINLGNGQGKKISPEDNFQIYHRILDSETETDTNLGKGKFPYKNRIYQMRLVGIGGMRGITNGYDINDKIKNQVYDQISTILSQGEVITPGDENIIRKDVFGDEFDGYNFEKLNMDLVAFYIDYEIKQRICPTKT